MKNPLERGPLRAPADGNAMPSGVIRRMPAKPYEVKPVAKREKPIPSREQQLGIVRWWRENRSIEWNPNKNNGRIRVNEADREIYNRRKEMHGAGYGSEGAGYLEYALLECFSSDGALKGRYDVTGGNVMAYEPSDIDDKLIGADGLLMYTDEDDERQGGLVAFDATLNAGEYALKRARGLQRTQMGDFAGCYWYDVESDDAGEAFDSPKEGKVTVINTTLFLPGELLEQYVADGTTAEQGDALLKRIGAIAANQQAWELELHARILTNTLVADRSANFLKERIQGMKRLDLLNELKRMAETSRTPKGTAAKILNIALPTAWQAEQEHPITNPRDKMFAQGSTMMPGSHVSRLRG